MSQLDLICTKLYGVKTKKCEIDFVLVLSKRGELMFSLGTIVIQVPALDRLMDYLQGVQQGNVDAATAQIIALNARLKQSNDRLAAAVQKEKAR